MRKKKIAILGSTGSIGTQALEVISCHKDRFEVEVLTAKNNSELLIKQAIEFQPNSVVIVNENKYLEVHRSLSNHNIKVYSGRDSLEQIVSSDSIDVVLTALVGYSGLLPTINAIKCGKTIALANKETLVVAGEIIRGLCTKHRANIIPVDSEHSAIFQCLNGEGESSLEKIFLTASGGPFRGKNRGDLLNVTRKEALNHPNWNMGPKITIDSASLMNKGLEVIEAKWLFDVSLSDIVVVVHPQSIIHSAVQFVDGSVIAQLGIPDMKIPIQYALGYPDRVKNEFARFSFFNHPELTFEKPDLETFKNLKLSYLAIEKGGNSPCVLNAANEVVVDAFLKEKIDFLYMSDLIENCLEKITFVEKPTIEDLVSTDTETRAYLNKIIY
ncbi:MAG: 1-deoxy-D-xylulose-5-phosphate reductoisomerase [Flavobacteriales bacterium]|nr:1-deoxy-D-xylulose-5-phosphate reductoisomerase [Flavobacteriales bacterium]|tara:strand:- start:1256 stop:2410 length:1155 start_codon:yes stop_codon:yes gene_type:complete